MFWTILFAQKFQAEMLGAQKIYFLKFLTKATEVDSGRNGNMPHGGTCRI